MNEQLFTGKSSYYEMSRPVIAEEAFNYLYSLLPLNAVIADVGAGTGKFTTLAAKRGNTVFAIEPNAEMQMVLINNVKNYPNVIVLNSCAEDTHIPSNSVDVVISVTAIHWFDLDAFRTECYRILKPNGMVVAVYNSQKEELRKLANNHSYKTATDIFFDGKCEVIEFSNPQQYTREKYLAYYLSHSNAPKLADDDYTLFFERINASFDREQKDGMYLFDFVTVMYIDRDFQQHRI